MRKLIISLSLVLIPLCAAARSFNAENLPYKDIPEDRATSVAVSVLTEAGIVKGNPDGTFRPERNLNRAEFLEMVMRFLGKDPEDVDLNCFPDVFATAWYAESVCRAKALGIVEGNSEEGVKETKWKFAPARPVQYVEALKMLSIIFGISLDEIEGDWYEKYLQKAKELNIALEENPNADYLLTRGDMARVTVRYLAHSENQLDKLIDAELGNDYEDVEEEEDTSTEPSTEEEEGEEDTEPETQTGAVEEDESSPVTFDEFYDSSQATVVSSFVPLGEISPILASASVFSDSQPVDVESILIRFNTAPTSIKHFLVYDHDTKFIGNAYVDPTVSGNIQYKLSLGGGGDLVLGKREDYSFYIRARTKTVDEGGDSGEIIQVARLGIEGDGVWNNKTQTEYALGPFPAFQTARAMITKVENGSNEEGILISGSHMRLGSFKFTGREATGSGSSEVEITDLEINVNVGNGITITNVWLTANDTSAEMSCSIAGNIITCASMDASFGVVPDDLLPRTLTFYGDIAIASDVQSSHLQLSINTPGNVLSAGSVRWTDGDANFHWVPGDAPVARSTVFSY